jgi:hypothetical protein
MAEMVTDPIATVSAVDEPETPDIMVVETSTTIPRLPLIGPTSAMAKFTRRRDTPPYSMSPPARMKRGAEMRGNESRTVKNR